MFADGEISYKVKLDGNEADKTLNSLKKSSDSLSDKFVSFGTKMTVGVTAPLTALATAGVKYNATMESYLANLTTLLGGNQQEAQKLLDTLREMANTTPYEATDLVKATQKMMAFGISAQDSLKYLQMLGDVAMGDANKMDSLTLAFSQISASGKASMEDINQMIDQGFNPLTIIAQKTGESMSDLRDRVSDGAVSFQEIAGAFQTATSEGGIFYQSMDKASETTNGKISSLKDAFSTALGDMTESLLPFVTDAVKGLSDVASWFSNLDENGKKTVLTLAGIAMAIGPVTTAIGTLIKVGNGIKQMVAIIKSWHLATKLMTAAQTALNVVMSMNPITLIIIAIVALIAILVLLWTKCEWFRDGVMDVINSVAKFFSDLGSKIVEVATNIWNAITETVSNIWNAITETVSNIWNSITSFFSMVGSAISSFFQMVLSYLQWPIQFVTNMFLLIVAIVAMFLETIYNLLVTVVTTVFNFLSTIAMWIYNNVLMPIVNFFVSVVTTIFNLVVSYVNLVLSVFSTIAMWIYNNVLLPVFNFFVSVFEGIWNVIQSVIDWIINGFQTVASFILNAFNTVKNTVINGFQTVVDFILNAFNTVKNTVINIFNAIATTVRNIFNTIVNVVKAPINGLITLFNNVIKGLNKIKVPDWVPGVGGKGINIPLIPKLATGTNYVAGEGLAYLHKGEAVVPKKYNPAIGGYGNYNQPIYVNVVADMDVNKFGKAFVRDIKTFSGGTKNSYNYGGGK